MFAETLQTIPINKISQNSNYILSKCNENAEYKLFYNY